MIDVIWWLVTVEAVGLIAFPIAYALLPRLADRGFTASKPFGILLIAYACWILSQLHILPSVRMTIVALLLMLAGISGRYAWTHRQELRAFVVREHRTLIVSELIFLIFFFCWAAYRAYDPAINHTEQPMDFALLNASIESRFGTPEDPWLRGEGVSYYYFGYWMMGTLSELSGIESHISYNLSLALIPAMSAIAMFGLVYNIVSGDISQWGRALMSGLAAVLLVGIVANLEGVLEFMRANGMGSETFWDWTGIKLQATNPVSELMTSLTAYDLTQSWRPEEPLWWFRATRVIDSFDGARWADLTIQEFPFFSFMLGDLHPHVMSIPYIILFSVFTLNFFRAPTYKLASTKVHGHLTVLVMGLVLGGLAFTNMWDLPTLSALFLSVTIVKAYPTHTGSIWRLIRAAIPITGLVIGLAFLLYAPYYVNFKSSVTGIVPVNNTTTSIHLFIVWGLHLIVVTPFIIGAFWQTTVSRDWRQLTALSMVAGFLPYIVWTFLHLETVGTTLGLWDRFFHVLPFSLLISVSVYSVLWLVKQEGASGKVFTLILSGLGLSLIMGPELFFVRDLFGSRMNTVFKLYYQAWVFLAAASGFALCHWWSLRQSLRGWQRSLTTLWAATTIILLVGSLYYSPAAAASKGGPFTGEATLDGLAYVAHRRQAEYNAIKFVKKNLGEGSAIVEAVGEWFDAGLISRSTGVPTVINWPGHQLQWRGSTQAFRDRSQDVATIYQTRSIDKATDLLVKYNVQYVYVGPRERQSYGLGGLDKFNSFMDTVFNQDNVFIYKLRH